MFYTDTQSDQKTLFERTTQYTKFKQPPNQIKGQSCYLKGLPNLNSFPIRSKDSDYPLFHYQTLLMSHFK